ncbi:glutathione S-transferase N-terminal domain-containing protein [Phenylobacterium sp.]|uniref:glutathione S-transferase N-terminal domain-containing protein n=1 Tax=Phenylobacterium sp. TaxID=1871053 RepID=UPI0035B15744
MATVLFDLAASDPAVRFSPYCWRIRLALAHKAVKAETLAWRFTDKEAIAPSGQTTAPVLVDNGRWIGGSLQIADHLEAAYADAPTLFGGPTGRALTEFFHSWADAVLLPGVFSLIALDVLQRLAPQDQPYFRASRERFLGTSIEVYASARDTRISGVRESWRPLRQALRRQLFLGGEARHYADYIAFAAFQWARCMSPYAVMDDTDPLVDWRERMLDLHDGLARSAATLGA